MRPGKIDVMIVGAVLVCYAAVIGPTVPTARFSYDEADYMYAVSKGFTANYLDRPTIPLATFIQKGLGEGMNESERVSLSDFIRSSDDIAFYRHFHPPLYTYWLILQSKVFGLSEQAIRRASFACLFLAFVALWFGCVALAKRAPRITAALASALVLTNPVNIATARMVTPHTLYVVTVIIALFAMARFVDTGKVRHWYVSLAAVTLGILTIEYAVLLVATLAVCAFVRRADLFAGRDRRQVVEFAGRSLMLVVGMFALLWLAGLFKLTLVKNYTFFAYFSIVRIQTFGNASAGTVWLNRIVESPFEFGILIVGVLLGVFLLIRHRADIWLVPFAAYGFLMLLTTLLNRSPEPTYISSLVPTLAVIAGAAIASVLSEVRPVLRVSITAGIVGALAVAGFVVASRPPSSDAPANVVMDLLLPRDRTTRERMLMPNFVRPTVHYYFPNLSANVYPDSLRCAALHELVESKTWDGIICRGSGQDTLQRQLEQRYDVAVRRLGSRERGRELVYYRLDTLGRR